MSSRHLFAMAFCATLYFGTGAHAIDDEHINASSPSKTLYPDSPSEYTDISHCTPPKYPASSRQNGETGTTVVRYQIDKHGIVQNIGIRKSSGYLQLDRATLEAVRNCQFKIKDPDTHSDEKWHSLRFSWKLSDEAKDLLDDAIKNNPKDAQAYLQRGWENAKSKDYALASKDFETAIGLDPKIADAYVGRASVLSREGEFDKALQAANTAIQLDPNLAHAYSVRGAIHLSQGGIEQGLADLDTSIRLHPDAGAYAFRAKILSNLGKIEESFEDSNKAIELDPDIPTAYMARALGWVYKKDMDRALEDANKALELDGASAEAYYVRGCVFQAREEIDQAISDFTAAIQIEPQLAVAYLSRGLARVQKKEEHLAASDIKEAVRLNPQLTTMMKSLVENFSRLDVESQ